MQRHNLRRLPQNKTPVGTRCIQLTIPDDDEWENQLYSQAYELALWMLWERESAHYGTLVAKQWKHALLSWKHCSVLSVDDGVDCDCEDDMGCCLKCINGVLSNKDCNGVYQPLPGCAPSGPSSTGGAPQPQPGGGQQDYNNCLSASVSKPAPFTVSTGDTIELTSFSDSWNDPTRDPVSWRGPNGLIDFSGSYLPGTQEVFATDPLPSAPHMSLIASIGGTFYPLFGAILTIPSGVSNAQVFLQANDNTLSDNQGSICYTLNVTNNQPVSYSHTFDYSISPFSSDWHPLNLSYYTPSDLAVYVPGSGYQTVFYAATGSPTFSKRAVAIESTIAAHITRIVIEFDYAPGVFLDPAGQDSFYLDQNGTQTNLFVYPSFPATPFDTGPIDIMMTTLDVVFLTGSRTDGADPGGSCTIKKITIYGLGSDPY